MLCFSEIRKRLKRDWRLLVGLTLGLYLFLAAVSLLAPPAIIWLASSVGVIAVRKVILVLGVVAGGFILGVAAAWLSGMVWLSLQEERRTWREFLAASMTRFGSWIVTLLLIQLATLAGLFILYYPLYIVLFFAVLTPFVFWAEGRSQVSAVQRAVALAVRGGWPFAARLLLLGAVAQVLAVLGRLLVFGASLGVAQMQSVAFSRAVGAVFVVLFLAVGTLFFWVTLYSLAYFYQTIAAREQTGLALREGRGYRWWQKALVLLGFFLVATWQLVVWLAQAPAS